jgi:PAS domain S-box-containing protein
LQASAAMLQHELAELREAQQALEELRHDYAEIHDLASAALLSVGKDGAIRSANLAAAELLGQERHALILQQLYDFVLAADRRRVRDYLTMQCSGLRRGCEARLRLANGRVVPVLLCARTSWRRPGVEHVTLTDLRERELDAWEKQQLALAAVRARAADRAKGRLIILASGELGAQLQSLTESVSALREVPLATHDGSAIISQLEERVEEGLRVLGDLLEGASQSEALPR